MPQPPANVTFSAGVEALRRIEEQRSAREARMRNALEILADPPYHEVEPGDPFARFVRATARKGLGREPQP